MSDDEPAPVAGPASPAGAIIAWDNIHPTDAARLSTCAPCRPGRDEERAAIVALLRDFERWRPLLRRYGAEGLMAAAADAIEDGEHLTP